MSFYREKPDKKKPVAKVPRAPGVPRQTTSNVTLSLDNTSTAENIYLDCVFRNESIDNYNNVTFRASRNIPILNAREDYKLGVISVNGLLNIPLIRAGFRMEFALDWDGVPPIHAIHVFTHDIFNVWEFVEQFNTSLTTLWRNFVLTFQGAGHNPDTDVNFPYTPGLTYDEPTQTFTLWGSERMADIPQPGGYNPVVPPHPNPYAPVLYIDLVTASLLYGMTFTEGVGVWRPFDAVVFNRGFADINVVEGNFFPPYNPPGVPPVPPLIPRKYIKNTQDFPSIGTWHKTNSLIITSNNLGGRNVQISRGSNDPQSSSSEVLNIIDSFPINLHGGFNRTIIYSNPNINYVDVMSTGPLNEVEFSLQMMNRDGVLETLQIPPRSTIVVKFVFSKTLFTAI